MKNLKKLFEQATARPWRIVNNPVALAIDIRGPKHRDDGSSLCISEVQPITDRESNAQLIALAANHFEALVEALERTADVIGHNSCTDGNTPNGFVIALEHARSVLAAIEKDASHV